VIISVINLTNGKVPDSEVQRVLRAINRQISEDFEPYWSLGATLRLEGHSGALPDKQHPADMRGDAVIYLWDRSDVPGAIGYHDRNYKGVPYGFVFLEVAKALGEDWSVTMSHEALELILDPEVNLLVAGPHPREKNRTVFFWYEACDAVQSDTYAIDGVKVSDFVLPLYFTGGDEYAGRNDFLGIVHNAKTLTSFGVNPGGYVGFYDPKLNKVDTVFGGKEAEKRHAERTRLLGEGGSRMSRYQQGSHASQATKGH
jgi:hypothetical protein